MSTPVDNSVDDICIRSTRPVDDCDPPVDCRGLSGVLVTVFDVTDEPDVQVEVRRSARRRRTVAAYRDGDRIIVMIPARFTRAQEAEYVASMVARLHKADRANGGARNATRRRGTDTALARRADDSRAATWTAGLSRRACAGWRRCGPVGPPVRPSTGRSDSASGCARCHPGCRTTSSFTSSRTWSSPATGRTSGRSCAVPSHRAGPRLPGRNLRGRAVPIADDLADDLGDD